MKGIIISGTARSGKSFLVEHIKENKLLITYKVDLLLIQSLRYKKPKNFNELENILIKYAQKTRYTDAKKKKTAVLFNGNIIKKVIDSIKFQRKKILPQYIIELIEKVTLKKNKWVAADLHVEMIFEELKKRNKNLFLIVLIRNPVESITASLYWRDYPNIYNYSKKIFLYKLLYWKLTFYVATALERKFPDCVKIVQFNKLKKKRGEINFFNESFRLKESFYRKNFFDYDIKKGSFCPDYKWKKLLDEDDINFIKRMTGKKIECKKKILIFFVTISAKFLFLMAKINPILSKKILDFCFFPLKIIRRIIFIKFLGR